ncbi:DUF2202 domain-containing protein [Aestuariibaculum sp. YM273]|uniref:DUF2202 domain-containing protein n=1 Tax=Aestuariibaculum sp. YM273 TaxID=3070659 RepID=UPI0027DC4583|nr:DUF2202 domain-containing protein [Aestuariibaculum sp. YM273]WMI66536.1 DUF2202 domain-containing protein [Aestuariibaculum sp. YM273]
MKTYCKTPKIFVLLFTITMSLLYSCDSSTNENEINSDDQIVTTADKDALLFMLEEEKLARDTYTYLNDKWAVNQFANIKNSEQSHMNAIENLLIEYGIEYSILPTGQFKNAELQIYYNQFINEGSVNQSRALMVGATIEDLDIVDLQEYIDATKNTQLISVFQSLQCGSRNHLRSFEQAIDILGETYEPQFLSLEEYNVIINTINEKCG